MSKPHWEAIVLCGGQGSRLHGHITTRQKTIVSVAGRPFLAWVLRELARFGCRRCVLAAGVGTDEIKQVWPQLNQQGMDLVLHEEPQPLGTGGALAQALQMVVAPEWVLLNGDSFCRVDYVLLRRHHSLKGRPVTVVTAAVPQERPKDYGMVVLDETDKVTAFLEKSDHPTALHQDKQRSGMYAGIAWMDERIRSHLLNGPCSLEHDLLPRWVRDDLVQGFWTDENVWDIGTPQRLKQAQEELGQLFSENVDDEAERIRFGPDG